MGGRCSIRRFIGMIRRLIRREGGRWMFGAWVLFGKRKRGRGGEGGGGESGAWLLHRNESSCILLLFYSSAVLLFENRPLRE